MATRKIKHYRHLTLSKGLTGAAGHVRSSLIARRFYLRRNSKFSLFYNYWRTGRMELPFLNFLAYHANFRNSRTHAADVVETADVVWGSAKFKERRTRGQGNVWKIGGEGAARYPGIGMSSLARNFALIIVSYLFAWVSCSRFPFYSFFLFPFSRFLLAVDTCFRLSFPLSR